MCFICRSGYYNPGLDRITDQIVNPKMMPVLYPKVEKIVCEHLNIPYVPSVNVATPASLPQGLSYGEEESKKTEHKKRRKKKKREKHKKNKLKRKEKKKNKRKKESCRKKSRK